MNIKPFALERYFAKYEFSAKYLLCSSDCDGLAQSEVLSWAKPDTRELWDNLKLGYTESLGLPLLREEVARLYKGISADNVLIAVPSEGIFLAVNAVLKKGDHVICTWPGYQSLYAIAESIGCEVTKWEPSEKDGWKFDPEFLEKNIRPNTKLIVVNFPHNPTGYLPPPQDFQKILDIVKKQDAYVFSDEMYRFLELDPEDRLPSACELYEKAVSLFGMSKSFGMAGARIGWVVTQDKELYQRMAALKDYTTIDSSAPSEILTLIALRAKEKILARHLERMKRNLALLDNLFAKHQKLFNWTKPKAGTICFPKILFAEDAFTFCERVVSETGIMLLPSTVYNYGDKHFRIGFGRENMPEVLAKFDEYLSHKSWLA